jgi:hypothetical protein
MKCRQYHSHRFILAVGCLFGFVLSQSTIAFADAPVNVIDIGNRKQLFVDETFIASSRNIDLTMNPPVKTGEVLIKADQPWEQKENAVFELYGSVLKEGNKVRVWYDLFHAPGGESSACESFVCYAESDDGRHFQKPALGLHEVNGSKANNVVLSDATGGCAVWIDPKAPAEHRYKTQAKTYPKGNLSMYSSPDGLRWKFFDDINSGPGGRDTQTIVFWDESIQRYVMYTRRKVLPKPKQWAHDTTRSVRRLESDDLKLWEQQTTVLEADAADLAIYPTPTEPPVDY